MFAFPALPQYPGFVITHVYYHGGVPMAVGGVQRSDEWVHAHVEITREEYEALMDGFMDNPEVQAPFERTYFDPTFVLERVVV